jgi:hypothetical protein
MNIYISKINDVEVIQASNSVLSSRNKTSTRGDINKGKNKIVDLGEGVKELNSQFYIKDNSTFKQLFDIVSKERSVTIVDKFLGEIKCSISSYSFKNSDKHLGLTILDIKFIITEDFNPKVDYRGKILVDISNIQNNITPKYLNVDIKQTMKSLYDNDDVLLDLNDKFATFTNYYNNINLHHNKIRDIFDVIKNIKHIDFTFKQLYKTTISIPKLKFHDIRNLKYINTTVSNLINKNSNTLFVNNLLLISNLSNILNAKNRHVLNNLESNIKQLCNDCDIINTSNVTNTKIDLDYIDIFRTVQQFIKNSDKNIYEIDVNLELVSRVVYKIYKNLDYLEDILFLNNLHTDTLFKGKLKLFR